MTIPETRLFDNWTQRSLCIELTFFIYVFSVFALLLFVVLPFFLVFVVVVVFLLSCLLDFSAFVVGVLCDCCVTFRFCVCVCPCVVLLLLSSRFPAPSLVSCVLRLCFVCDLCLVRG